MAPRCARRRRVTGRGYNEEDAGLRGAASDRGFPKANVTRSTQYGMPGICEATLKTPPWVPLPRPVM
jgi:hypothetical protein